MTRAELINKEVTYKSGYANKPDAKYIICETYEWMTPMEIEWVDLVAVTKDLFSHYTHHHSVRLSELKKYNPELL